MISDRPDSATSCLLFLYRLASASGKASGGAPGGTLKISSIIRAMRLFGKSESAVRMSLSRAVKSGLFSSSRTGDAVGYGLTDAGRTFLMTWELNVDAYVRRWNFRQSEWDGRWTCLLFSRNTVIPAGILRERGFGRMLPNVWVSPFPLSGETENSSDRFGSTAILRSAALETEERRDVFLERVFGLEEHAAAYGKFIAEFEPRLTELKTVRPVNGLLPPEISVPLLYSLGSVYFSRAFTDPLLPRAVLPEWIGDRAFSIMSELTGLLMPSAKSYFSTL